MAIVSDSSCGGGSRCLTGEEAVVLSLREMGLRPVTDAGELGLPCRGLKKFKFTAPDGLVYEVQIRRVPA